MTDDPRKGGRRLDRRGFLALAGGGGASAVAVAVTDAVAGQPAGPAQAGDKAGYAETDHVRAYYDSARL